MFKRIIIELTEPLCTCETLSISWSVEIHQNKTSLNLECKLCGTHVTIPHEKFVAGFSVDRPYPEQHKQKKKGAKLILLQKPEEDEA